MKLYKSEGVVRKTLTMETVSRLGGAAPAQLKKKRVGGVTGGIREGSSMVEATVEADLGLKKLDDKRREWKCMQVMEKSWMNSLGFVDLMVHGKTTRALMDTGATHNFMTTRLAKEVGLMIFPSNVEVKVVNSRAKVAGLAHEVPV